MCDRQCHSVRERERNIVASGISGILSRVFTCSHLFRRVMDSMCDIYYGRRAHPWAVDIEEWNVDASQKIKDYEEAQRRSEMA